MTISSRPRIRSAAVLLLPLCAALFVAACGGDDDAKRSTPKKTAKPGTITQPKADAALTKQLGQAGAVLLAAGCEFGTFEAEEANHVTDAKDLEFGTFPPTSGTHFDSWAPFGRYDEPIEDGYAVHNLEHGGVVVWHGTKVSEEVVDGIDGLLEDGEKWVLAPRADIDGLYSAAWGKGLSCPPASLDQLSVEEVTAGVDAWYGAVVSTGSEAEKDVPAYAGTMKEPTPVRDISEDNPF